MPLIHRTQNIFKIRGFRIVALHVLPSNSTTLCCNDMPACVSPTPNHSSVWPRCPWNPVITGQQYICQLTSTIDIAGQSATVCCNDMQACIPPTLNQIYLIPQCDLKSNMPHSWVWPRCPWNTFITGQQCNKNQLTLLQLCKISIFKVAKQNMVMVFLVCLVFVLSTQNGRESGTEKRFLLAVVVDLGDPIQLWAIPIHSNHGDSVRAQCMRARLGPRDYVATACGVTSWT